MDTGFPRGVGKQGKVLDRSDLRVGQSHGDERRIRAQHLGDGCVHDAAAAVDGQVAQLEAVRALEVAAAF